MSKALISIPFMNLVETLDSADAYITVSFGKVMTPQVEEILNAWNKAQDINSEICIILNPLDLALESRRRGTVSEARVSGFLDSVRREMARIQEKWPGNENNLAALTEEVGELAKAMLEREYEPTKGIQRGEIYREAVQVAAVALKIALFGDDSFSKSKPDWQLGGVA